MSSIPENPFILVDGSSYLFRAYYAPPHLTNSSGEPTGAIYGVVNMLKSLMNQYQPTHMAVVFDAKGKTFRNDLYEDYKANRPPMPDDLRTQIAPLHEIIQAMGLPLVVIDYVEADDVIGTLAKYAAEAGHHTLISTSDKDMAQLVNDRVTLINTFDNRISTPEAVVERFGVRPDQIIDYLALMGDSSDNIPGMPGVGEKTAQAILQGVDSIDAMLAEPEKVAELSFRGAKSMPKKIAEHKDILLLSRELATIKLDVELPLSEASFRVRDADKEQLIELYKKCEFRRWLAELLEPAKVEPAKKEDETTAAPKQETTTELATQYEIITTETALKGWIEKLKKSACFAFDTETTSLNYMEAELVGISFSVKAGEACYIPFIHQDIEGPQQLNRAEVLQQLKPIFENQALKKIGQNIKYDAHILAHYDIQVVGIYNDTMLASYVLNSVNSRHDMDTLSLQYLGHKTTPYEAVAGKGAKQKRFDEIPIEVAAAYAAEDADITFRLHEVLWPKIQAEPSLKKVLEQLELPLVSLLQQIERHGVLIDESLLHKQSKEIEVTLGQIEKDAFEIAGAPFNLNSPKQLQTILFEEQGLPVKKKTPKGAPSTAEDVLQELALDYPLPKLILQHRGLAKLKSTYTDKLPRMVNPLTGRIHTSYHQAVTATGRLSSTEPNLQNIPIRNEAGRRVRQAFIAPKGSKIIAIDYSQIELRIMAHISGSEGLLQAFARGRDIHKATASEVFSVPLEQVTSEQRRRAKAVNFGLIYGMSAFGLAKQLQIGQKEAQQYIDTYFERFPGVHEYMERTRADAAEKGYVETIFGRRLYLPEINAKNIPRRKAAERAAINAPMQGSAADIIKKAMLDIEQWLSTHAAAKEDIKMLMQVHDELVFEIKTPHLETYVEKLVELMEQAVKLDVPLIAEAGIGDNWDEAH